MTETNSKRTLLAVFAHPDDESFGSGGTLALTAADGYNVVLACATRGEAGEIADPALATPETLAEVRAGELQEAADALGISELIFLGYRDSGMAGTPENEDPRAYVQADEDEVVAKLVGIIRRLKPEALVTFDPNGGYGHPDHMAASRHTLAAVQAAGDADRFPDEGEPWKPSRLFYVVFPISRLVEMRDAMKALGQDTSRYDTRIEQGMGWADDDVHMATDVSPTIEAKWKALRVHRTQHGTFWLFSRIPEADAKSLLSREFFSQIWPEPESGLSLKHFFDGL